MPTPVPHSVHSITPGAAWVGSCSLCKMRADIKAETGQEAFTIFAGNHDKRHAEYLSVDAVDYSEHPLYKGRA